MNRFFGVLYYTLLAVEWVILFGGLAASVPLWLSVSPEAGLLSIVAAMVSLNALKLESISFGNLGSR